MKRVLLTALVVILLLAGTTAVLAGPPWWAEISPEDTAANVAMIHYQERREIIHLWQHPELIVLGSYDGRHRQLTFGFEWVGRDVAALQAALDDPDHDITVSFNGTPPVSVKNHYQPAFMAVPDVGPAWTWDHDNDGLDDGDGDGVGDFEGPHAFFRWRWDWPHWYRPMGDHVFEFCVTWPEPYPPSCDFVSVRWR